MEKGWQQTEAKNRMIIFKNKLGHCKWWETGRVRIFVKKPVNEAKKLQLLADCFYNTELITDLSVFKKFYHSFYLKNTHLTYDVGVRIPPFKIEFELTSLDHIRILNCLDFKIIN